jgi:UDP-2-acetamido-3-amino-2,3-dideoxy-glucuronate N-acetyltransferase
MNVQSKREQMITRINNGVKIGANVTIICGVDIGIFSFIASASIITNDVRAYALIMGNPAKQTGWVSEHGSKLNFLNKEKMASCPISGFTYKLAGLSLRRLR